MKEIIQIIKKQKILSLCVGLGVLLFIGTGTVYATDTVARSSMISEEDALGFALLDAGVSEEDVTEFETELDRNGFGYVYEVEFATEGAEYSYKINVKNGSVIERENNITKTQTSSTSNEKLKNDTENGTVQSSAANASGTLSYISLEEAKKIVLEHAELAASDVTFSKAMLEDDDSEMVYEINFFTQDYDYEYELNAYTGKIQEVSREKYDSDDVHDASNISTNTAVTGTTQQGTITTDSNASDINNNSNAGQSIVNNNSQSSLNNNDYYDDIDNNDDYDDNDQEVDDDRDEDNDYEVDDDRDEDNDYDDDDDHDDDHDDDDHDGDDDD